MARRVDPRSISLDLERLLPGGGPGLRVVEWGIVAWAGLGLAALLWATDRLLSRVAGVIPFLVTAGLVVLMLNPAVSRLSAAGVPRRLAAVVVSLAALALTGFALAFMVPLLAHQGENLLGSSPGLFRRGGTFTRLARSHNAILRAAGEAGSRWLRTHAADAPSALRTATHAGLKLAHFGVILVLGGFLGFLILVSLPEIGRGLAALIPPNRRAAVEPTLAEARRIVSGYVRARLVVSAVVGGLATLGLWAVHMPYWLVLGAVVGVANLIPMLGSWIGAIPVALVTLLTKPPAFLFVVLAVVVVAHAVDGYILSPLLLREATDLHPVVILLAVLVGVDLLGFWGILAAIPVAGVTQFLLRTWVLPRIAGEPKTLPVPERN